MTFSLKDIRKKNTTDKRKVISVMDGSGCYFIQEPNSKNSRRFELRMRFPSGRKGKMQYIPLGKWGKEIKSVPDAIGLSTSIQNWSNINNKNPKLYFR